MKKRKWYYGMPAKTGIFLLLMISIVILGASAAGCILMWEHNIYTASEDAMLQNQMYNLASGDACEYYYSHLGSQIASGSFLAEGNISYLVTMTMADKDISSSDVSGSGQDNGYFSSYETAAPDEKETAKLQISPDEEEVYAKETVTEPPERETEPAETETAVIESETVYDAGSEKITTEDDELFDLAGLYNLVDQVVDEEDRASWYQRISGIRTQEEVRELYMDLGVDVEMESASDGLEESYSLESSLLLASDTKDPSSRNQTFIFTAQWFELLSGINPGYDLTVIIDGSFQSDDIYAKTWVGIKLLYALRYWIYGIIALSLLVAICSFVFLMCSAGHRVGQDEIAAGTMIKIPLEVYGMAVLILLYIPIVIAVRNGYSWILCMILMLGYEIPGCIAVCMNLAVRVKIGTFWKNTLCARLLRLAWKVLKGIWEICRQIAAALPTMGKLIVFCGIIFVAELFTWVIYRWDPSAYMSWFFIEKIIEATIILYAGMQIKRLEKGAEALAKGNLEYQADLNGMMSDFRKQGEYLNSIGAGMTAAVEERMKSERMKTELITNVSHDIKTPLTSIISYTDLIIKEHSENPKVDEYAQVLIRQSVRLKKLIEDLVEASKASTGNLEVALVPMDVGVILIQTTGEYTERLEARGLKLVVRQPEEKLMILADGRRLWRVIENLMNNVCKYAQTGTRVYLSLERKGEQVVITLKNTSSYELDIPAEELMERFVRGDKARSTEGNGLGLSIAQSLTELQGGRMELAIDGDLFKAILYFQLAKGIPEEADPESESGEKTEQ